jgi:hypothetical protein
MADALANVIVVLPSVDSARWIVAGEQLNRHWYEKNTGQVVTEVQRQLFHPVHRWMAATLDGRVEATGAVFEAKFMLPWNFSEESARGLHTVGFTGGKGQSMGADCDHLLVAPVDETAVIQQIHLAVAHAICNFLEQALHPVRSSDDALR